MPDPTFLPFCSIGLILVDFRLQQWRLSSICYSFFGGILNGSAQFIDGHELRTLPVLHFRGLRFTTLLWRPASAVTRYRGFVDTSPGCCIYAIDKIRHCYHRKYSYNTYSPRVFDRPNALQIFKFQIHLGKKKISSFLFQPFRSKEEFYKRFQTPLEVEEGVLNFFTSAKIFEEGGKKRQNSPLINTALMKMARCQEFR